MINEKIVETVPETKWSKRRNQRVNTRYLNFKFDRGPLTNWLAEKTSRMPKSASGRASPALLTIIGGPGLGTTFSLTKGASQIGRGEGQDIELNFGDNSISRESHASITYYGSEGTYLLRDGHKPNPVRLNGKTVQGEQALENGDVIQLGETSLRFQYSSS